MKSKSTLFGIILFAFIVTFLSGVSAPDGIIAERVEYHESDQSGLKFRYFYLDAENYERALLDSKLKWIGDNKPCQNVGNGCTLTPNGEYNVFFPN